MERSACNIYDSMNIVKHFYIVCDVHVIILTSVAL